MRIVCGLLTACALAYPAGALANGAARPPIDLSRAAYRRFVATWRYEVVVARDVRVHSDRTAWQDGRLVCEDVVTYGDAPAGLAAALSSNYGYTGSGGQAVVAAALRTLCPDYNTNYTTYWDQAVLQAQDELQQRGFAVGEIATGRSVRAVCDYLDANRDSSGLLAFMQARRTVGGMAAVRVLANAAVDAWCSGDRLKLGPWWFM